MQFVDFFHIPLTRRATAEIAIAIVDLRIARDVGVSSVWAFGLERSVLSIRSRVASSITEAYPRRATSLQS